MINLRHRQKLLTWCAGLVVILLVGDKLVFSYLTPLWTKRSHQMAMLTQSLNNGRLLLDREKTIRERWSNMRSNALPANVSVAENKIFKSVDRWVQTSRISFTSIKPQWKQPAKDYMTLECRADGFGNIQSLARFLYELERDPLALKVDDLEISARDSEGQQLSLGVRFSGLLLVEENK